MMECRQRCCIIVHRFGQPPIYALFNQRTLDPIAAAAIATVANVSAITTPAVQSEFGKLWGFIENYRATHPPHPPPAGGSPIPPPQFNVSVVRDESYIAL